MILIDSLIPTQVGIRDHFQVMKMIKFVQEGGFFTLESLKNNDSTYLKLIQLPRFPDGNVYIHDGHHRIRAIWASGRNYLREDEYRTYNETYDRYLELNPDEDWFTPFDPRTEVRIANFYTFKRNVRKLYMELGIEFAQFIVDLSKDVYKCERKFQHIKDLQ